MSKGRRRGGKPAERAYGRLTRHERNGLARLLDEGWCGVANIELRRKVGYRPRRRSGPASSPRHSARRSHDAFLALGEGTAGAVVEESQRKRQRVA